MASVYASSPVEQATTHARSPASSVRSWAIAGNNSCRKTSHMAGSRKKLVTPMSSSLKSSVPSAGFSRM